MAEIRWGKLALRDLKAIHAFISIDSRHYAKRQVERILARVGQLASHPESGRMVPEKSDPSIRELVEGNYRIFYSCIAAR
jgi:plasmid stabilization system protein ParE